MSDLPEFDRPPVVEVALGVQFVPALGMQGLALVPLRQTWRSAYPKIQEQPPLPPSIEGGTALLPQLQFRVMPVPTLRQWFLTDDETELVQVQTDRLLINWRSGDSTVAYPRYGHMRETFNKRFGDLAQFAADEQFGDVAITQAELTYINAVDIEPDHIGRIGNFIRGWTGTPNHHLGEPEQARLTLTFMVPDMGLPPVRLYVEVNPAQRPGGGSVLFLTMTVRGNPGGRSLDDALKFLDEAHDHLVRSFAELTPDSMHEIWQRRK